MTADKPGRHAVYYVVGGDPGFAQLLAVSVASLRAHNPGVDVFVVCAERYAANVPLPEGVSVHLRDAEEECWLKALPPAALRAYDRVLYLDCDVLVCGPLDAVFEVISRPGVLYTCAEAGPEMHAHHFYSLGLHSPQTLADLVRRDARVFNCGQFGFVPCEAMDAHWAAVYELMSTHPGPQFMDQSAVNHYFATRGEVDHALTPFVKLEARTRDGCDAVLAHFTDASRSWETKLVWMRTWNAEAQAALAGTG